MKTTKKQPVVVTMIYPNGKRLEVRVPMSEAYAVLAFLEKSKEQEQAAKELRAKVDKEFISKSAPTSVKD